MKQIRLLPLVMVAVAGLLLVKVIGVVSGNGYVLSGVEVSAAQEAETSTETSDPSDEAGGEEVAEDSSDATEPSEPSDPNDEQFRDAPKSIDELTDESSERILLTRLADRRAELEKRESELSLRQDLIEAAEKRVEERFKLLQALEDKIGVSLKQKEEEEGAQFKSLVSMYELMKPAEAAVIFNRLNMDILVRVVRGMKARRMAGVLAKMSTDRAEELTIKLANYNPERILEGGIDDLDELPQIIGE